MGNLAPHTTIHLVIKKYGQEILSDVRWAYILLNYGTFDDLPDGLDIVKELQAAGYGTLLLNCKNSQDDNWRSKVDEFTDGFLSTHNCFDSSVVIHICDAIAYGLDLMTEDSIRDSIRKNGESPESISSTAPSDSLGGESPDPFPSTVSSDSPCGESQDSSSSKEEIDYAAELQKLQNDYISLLESSIVVPEGKLFKKPSGYFPISAQNQLYLLKQKICLLGKELAQDLDSWCEDEKQKVLDKHAHPVGPQRVGLFSAIAIPAIAIVVLISTLVSYLGARDSVSTFKSNISRADSLFQAKDYVAASQAYKFAGDSYNESFRHSKYEGVAESGAKKASASLVYDYLNKAQPLYDKGDYYEALKVLKSMPTGVDFTFDKKLTKRLTTMQTDLVSKCEILLSSEIDGFVKEISNKKGKPSKDVLDRIDYLLTVDSSNYWLNFIRNKSAEK